MIISEEGTKEQLPLSHEAQLNMERCASFVAKMIEKYGRKVLAEIEAEERQKTQTEDPSQMQAQANKQGLEQVKGQADKLEKTNKN